MMSAEALRWVLLLLCLSLSHQTGSFSVKVRSQVSGLLGSSVDLYCGLENNIDARPLEVRWYRPNLLNTPVLLYKNTQLQTETVDVQYQGRVFLKGELEKGDVSLKLENLTLADSGDYVCHVSSGNWYDKATVSLRVRVVGSTPVISLNEAGGGQVNVSCKSHGWLPEPSIIWTDKDGRDLKPLSKDMFTTNSEGCVDVSSWLIVSPSESEWISCSVGSSVLERKDSRMKLYVPAGSLNGYFIAIPILLLLLLLCAAGIAVYCVRRKKGVNKRRNRKPNNCLSFFKKNKAEDPGGNPSETEPLTICVDKPDKDEATSGVLQAVVVDPNSVPRAETPPAPTADLNQQKSSEPQNPEAAARPEAITSNTTPSATTSNTTPSAITSNTTPAATTSNTTPSATTSNTTPSATTSNTTPAATTSNTTLSATTSNTTPSATTTKTPPSATTSNTTPSATTSNTTPSATTTNSTSAATTTNTTPSATTTNTTSAATTTNTTPSATTTNTTSAATTSNTTPSATTSNTTPSATTSNTTPSATTSNTTPSATTSNTTPSATTSNTTPSATTSNTTPSATTSNTTPSATTSNTTPSATTSDTTPAATTTNTTPAATTTNTTPAATTTKTTPDATTTNTTPDATTSNTTSDATTTKTTPNATTTKNTPDATTIKTTSAATTTNTTPAATISESTPVPIIFTGCFKIPPTNNSEKGIINKINKSENSSDKAEVRETKSSGKRKAEEPAEGPETTKRLHQQQHSEGESDDVMVCEGVGSMSVTKDVEMEDSELCNEDNLMDCD